MPPVLINRTSGSTQWRHDAYDVINYLYKKLAHAILIKLYTSYVALHLIINADVAIKLKRMLRIIIQTLLNTTNKPSDYKRMLQITTSAGANKVLIR